LHHGQASYGVIESFSYLPLFEVNFEPLLSCQRNYVCNNDPYGDVMVKL
jgi:hypothetical protein